MKSNVELRNLAWKRLWADKWFGRLFGGGLLLSLCGYAVNVVIGGILGRLGVQDWQDYWMAMQKNRVDLTTPIPNLTGNYIFTATSSTALELFIGYIMAAIAAYGAAVILLRCLRNEEEGWLGAAFGGFRDPFGMLWMFVRLMLIYLGWILVTILPVGVVVGVSISACRPMFETATLQAGILLSCVFSLALAVFLAVYCIPFYRYRFAFLVKAEHPDWSAGECLRSCKALMKGNMMKSFRLDCSYWKPITLVLVLALAAVTAILLVVLLKDNKMLAALVGLGGVLALFASFAGGIVLAQYIGVGQGFFYEELKQQNERNA